MPPEQPAHDPAHEPAAAAPGSWAADPRAAHGYAAPADPAAPDGPPAATPAGGRRGGRGGRRGVGLLAVAALMLGSAAVGGVAGGLVAGADDPTDGQAPPGNALERPATPREQAAPAGSIEEVAQKVLPSVVSIQVATGRGMETGSGSILSSDGLVLTNHHVVADAADPGARMSVLLNDGSAHPAELIASHPQTDIAVIRILDVHGLTPITLGESAGVQVGQEVVAVGSPLGLTSTVTSGIISALNRPVSASGPGGEASVIDAIQTDAAINPGNSGGALVDMAGNLIGVPSVIASNTGGPGEQAGSIGLGFAIPVDQARRIADELIDDGQVTMPAINARIDTRSAGGALVGETVPGGAADRAGLRAGDLIVKVDERRIDSGVALIAAIRSRAVGDTVTLTIAGPDGADPRTLDVTLEAARD